MNTLNLFDTKIIHSLHNNGPILPKPFSSLYFRTPLLPFFTPINKASSSSSPLFQPQIPKFLKWHPDALNSRHALGARKDRTTRIYCKQPYLTYLQEEAVSTVHLITCHQFYQLHQIPKSLNLQNPSNQPLTPLFSFSLLFSLLKAKIIATIAATSLFFMRFSFNPKPAIAVSLSIKQSVSKEILLSDPKNVCALMKLTKIQIKNKKLVDAISTIDKLIELEPDKTSKWHLLKSLLHVYNKAKFWSNEILKKDPFLEKDYIVLLMMASQEDSIEELKKIKKKVEEGIINDSLKKKVEMCFEEFDRLVFVWDLVLLILSSALILGVLWIYDYILPAEVTSANTLSRQDPTLWDYIGFWFAVAVVVVVVVVVVVLWHCLVVLLLWLLWHVLISIVKSG